MQNHKCGIFCSFFCCYLVSTLFGPFALWIFHHFPQRSANNIFSQFVVTSNNANISLSFVSFGAIEWANYVNRDDKQTKCESSLYMRSWLIKHPSIASTDKKGEKKMNNLLHFYSTLFMFSMLFFSSIIDVNYWILCHLFLMQLPFVCTMTRVAFPYRDKFVIVIWLHYDAIVQSSKWSLSSIQKWIQKNRLILLLMRTLKMMTPILLLFDQQLYQITLYWMNKKQWKIKINSFVCCLSNDTDREWKLSFAFQIEFRCHAIEWTVFAVYEIKEK